MRGSSGISRSAIAVADRILAVSAAFRFIAHNRSMVTPEPFSCSEP
jgi:hypothetical protein